MELVALEGQFCDFLIGDFDTRPIVPLVELCLDAKPLGGCRVANQVDDDFTADQGTTAPLLTARCSSYFC